MTVKAIEKSIRQLKPVDQIRIVDNILAGLHGANSAVERAWGSESDKRLTAYRKNKTSGVSLEVIKGRLLQ